MPPVIGYMHVHAQKQGEIKGDVTAKGYEGWIEVDDASYAVVSPRDLATGQASGKRQHKPVSVTTPTGKHTPLLFEAVVTNEILQVTIDFFLTTASAKGSGTPAFTIELTNAALAGFDFNEQSGNDGFLRDRYEFTFQKIELTWAKGGISAGDDWHAPA
jgi:type VI secretion system secreted protein Hcp